MFKSFIQINKEVSLKIARLFPHTKVDPWGRYEKVVSEYMNSIPDCIVIDVGGGRKCPLAKRLQLGKKIKLIAVDISLEELKENRDVDNRVSIDVMDGLPFHDNSVDIITSRMLLEHLPDISIFVSEAKRVLKKGGYFINIFPSKFSPFAIINQLLPGSFSKRLLYAIYPESKGLGGFPSYYNKCYYSVFKPLLMRNNFKITGVSFGYYQSSYYSFFVPFFIVSMLYELLISSFEVKNLCDTLVFVAKKDT